jgi:hypothetical protein
MLYKAKKGGRRMTDNRRRIVIRDYLGRMLRTSLPFIVLNTIFLLFFITIGAVYPDDNLILIGFLIWLVLFISLFIMVGIRGRTMNRRFNLYHYSYALMKSKKWGSTKKWYIISFTALVFMIMFFLLPRIFLSFPGLSEISSMIVSFHIMMFLYFLLLLPLTSVAIFPAYEDWYKNIVVRHGSEVLSLDNGYTDRPYTMKIFEKSQTDYWDRLFKRYGQRMSSKLAIIGYETLDNAIAYYPPSPMLITALSSWWSSLDYLQKASKVIVHKDGNISVHVSKIDYNLLGVEVTYHELCQSILQTFAESIRAFMSGDENKAVEILQGRSE